jgi:hypothetical protein
MLLNTRKSRFARTLLLAAGLAAVCGSFGLHAEPASARSDLSPRPAWSPAGPAARAPHDCPACLAQRPVSIAPAATVPLRPEATALPVAASEVRWPERVAARPRRDRAPPSVS